MIRAILSPRPDRSAESLQSTGIVLLLVAIFVFTLMDAVGKHLIGTYPPLQIVWARYVGNMVILAVVFRQRLFGLLRTAHPWMQMGRGLTQMGSIGFFFLSLTYIGLAEATAIIDINPVLIVLLAALFLGEPLGPRRVAAAFAAMVGAMLIIRPGAGVFQPAALLPLAAALTYAIGAVLTRGVRGDSTATSVTVSILFGTVVTSLIVPFIWHPVAMEDLWAFVMVGVLGAIAQTLMVGAYRLAEAGAMAPFGYTGLIWATLWGWLFFGNLPDLWTVTGAGIIVASGIYIWNRERSSRKRNCT